MHVEISSERTTLTGTCRFVGWGEEVLRQFFEGVVALRPTEKIDRLVVSKRGVYVFIVERREEGK